MTFIRTVEGYAALPPGIYAPILFNGRISQPLVEVAKIPECFRGAKLGVQAVAHDAYPVVIFQKKVLAPAGAVSLLP